MTKDALIVLSGGMDSVTMLHDYRDDIALAVYFHYGSNHGAREAECARRQCAIAGVELVEIDLSFMATHFKSALLDGADAIPDADYAIRATMRYTPTVAQPSSVPWEKP